MTLDTEPGCLTESEQKQLSALGWSIRGWRRTSVYFGGVHAIAIDARGQIQAAGDPRRGGAAACV